MLASVYCIIMVFAPDVNFDSLSTIQAIGWEELCWYDLISVD